MEIEKILQKFMQQVHVDIFGSNILNDPKLEEIITLIAEGAAKQILKTQEQK